MRSDLLSETAHRCMIFRDSNEALDWLHERMPAILPDFEAVQEWLNPDLKGIDAVDILKPVQKSEVLIMNYR